MNSLKVTLYLSLSILFIYFSFIASDTLIKPKDIIDDCCCKKSTIDNSNEKEINNILNQIVKTRFFRYFRVNLQAECPFWVVSQLCGLEGCGVCECDDNEIPLPWRQEDSSDKVDLSPPPPGFTKWKDKRDDMWVVVAGADSDMSYVNLQMSQESNSGYDGNSVWRSIYHENCFTRPLDQMCFEERVFYRLISGLHSSISTHIALYYHQDKKTMEWEHNSQLFKQRFENHPDRIENLYFTFLFLLRSVGKISNLLTDYQFNTGNAQEDHETYQLVQQLLQSKLMCSPNFDESLLFKDSYSDRVSLVNQFKEHFQNISLILNCVTCEKCKLYGKMQTLGLGTALKILFEQDQVQSLQRNEIIALINTLRQLSNSIHGIEKLKTPYHKEYKLTYLLKSLLLNLYQKLLYYINNSNNNNNNIDDNNNSSPFSINNKKSQSRQTVVLIIISLVFILISSVYLFKKTKSKLLSTHLKNKIPNNAKNKKSK
ncbi:hypothetical protein DLAC_03555 [Tieghemostelium lacteum]|uniref:Endoplasmic reticulum oxidoreductin 1 n=1 Tax=Tieghemostelium lacteum TaxID=361077 RepID=A0A152A1H7_TIELA|nr:hypothetical protein DLAC_03555 [Tieghemostelium lacteum]|eukprot:KYQ99966.1 hypothetical protein DLAC_03555 [Tieghemostelium lacteum]